LISGNMLSTETLILPFSISFIQMINCTENFKKNTKPYFSDKLADLVILK